MTPAVESAVRAYNEAVGDGDRDQALNIIRDAVAAGLSPENAVFEIIIPAVERMADQIALSPESSLALHFLMARIGATATEEMVKEFAAPCPSKGRVVLGTALGDMHSLGRTIVGGCLKSLMFEVVDVGNNVSPEKFVDSAVDAGAQVIGVSSMMVHTALGENGGQGVRRILKERGLEGRIKLIVGGAPFLFDPLLYRSAQADAWAPDGVTAARVIGDLIRETDR